MAWDPPNTEITGALIEAADWNKMANSFAFLEQIAIQPFTATVNVTGTSFVNIVSLSALTYEAVPHMFEFTCARITCGGAGNLAVALRDGTTDLGWFAQLAASETVRGPTFVAQLTPSAASHTYQVSAQNSASQTSSFVTGLGGAGLFLPGHLRVYRVPT